MNDRPDEQRTAAQVQHSKWPGWIWAVPIAALGIVTWLAVRALVRGGVDIKLVFNEASGMKADDTSIKYLGYEVGKVTDVSLSKDGRHIEVNANINDEAKKFLTTGTRFWLEGANPSFGDPASLKAVVSGPDIIMDPGPGKPERHFVGLDHKPLFAGAHGPLISYTMNFDGDVGALEVDAPVKLRGFTVGGVTRIDFHYGADSGAIETPVTIALDRNSFHVVGGLRRVDDRAEPMLNNVLERLIGEGMRARLVQSPPMIGSYAIDLDFVKGVAPAHLITGGEYPEIPTTSGGGLDSIVHRVNAIPIDQISQRVLQIEDSVDAIVSSPRLQDSLKHLDSTLADLDKTIKHTGPQVTQLVDSLREMGNELDSAASQANRVLGGTPTNQDRNVRATLYEVTQAARSIRSLADYLERHPEALVRGKE